MGVGFPLSTSKQLTTYLLNLLQLKSNNDLLIIQSKVIPGQGLFFNIIIMFVAQAGSNTRP